MGDIDYECLDAKRPDVVDHYVYVGGWPEDKPRIFNNWFNSRPAGDAAASYGTLVEFARALGCYREDAPPPPPKDIYGDPPPGQTSPSPPVPPRGDPPANSITEKLVEYVKKEPILAFVGLGMVVIGFRWVARQQQ